MLSKRETHKKVTTRRRVGARSKNRAAGKTVGYVELPGSGEVKKVRRTRLKQLGASEPRRNGSVRFPNQIADAGVSAECG